MLWFYFKMYPEFQHFPPTPLLPCVLCSTIILFLGDFSNLFTVLISLFNRATAGALLKHSWVGPCSVQTSPWLPTSYGVKATVLEQPGALAFPHLLSLCPLPCSPASRLLIHHARHAPFPGLPHVCFPRPVMLLPERKTGFTPHGPWVSTEISSSPTSLTGLISPPTRTLYCTAPTMIVYYMGVIVPLTSVFL